VDPKNELRPAMLANFAIDVHHPIVAIALPANRVAREADGTVAAWVTTDRHRFEQKVIQTGMPSDGQVEILNGLRRGELAVSDGAVFLSNMLAAPPTD
jgi:multidrug efflux pump subunit AcrA (membrane-fusion protein)